LSGNTYTTGPVSADCTITVAFTATANIAQLFQGLNIPGARALVLTDRPLNTTASADGAPVLAMQIDDPQFEPNNPEELGYQWSKVVEGGEIRDLLFLDQDGNPYARHISNEFYAKCEGDADRCVSIEALLEIDQRYLLVAGALYFDPYEQGLYYMFLVDRDSGTTYSMALDEAAAAGGFGEYVFSVGLGGAYPKVLPNGDIIGEASGRHFILQTSDLGSGPLRYTEFPAITGNNGLDYASAFEVSDEYFLIYRGEVIRTGQPSCRVIDLLDGNRLIDVTSLLPIQSYACDFKRTDTGRIVVSTSEWSPDPLGLMEITRDSNGQLVGLEAQQIDCISTSAAGITPQCRLRNPPKSTIGGRDGLVVAQDGYVARGTWVAGRYFFGIGQEQIEELDSDAGTVTVHAALNEALCDNDPCNSTWVSSFASANFVWMFGLNENENYVVARLDPISRQIDRFTFDPDLEVYGLSLYSEDTLMFRADRISDLARLVGTLQITNQEMTYEVFANTPPEDLYVYPLTPSDLVSVDGNPVDWNQSFRTLLSGSDTGLQNEHLLAYRERFGEVLGNSHYFGLVEFNSPLEPGNHTRIYIHPYTLTLGPVVRELRLPAASHDGLTDQVTDLSTTGGLRLATGTAVEFSLPAELFALQQPSAQRVDRLQITGVVREVAATPETVDGQEWIVVSVTHGSPLGDSTITVQLTQSTSASVSRTAATVIGADGVARAIETDLGGAIERPTEDVIGSVTLLRIPRNAIGVEAIETEVTSEPDTMVLDSLP
jgi:hypothetical protein